MKAIVFDIGGTLMEYKDMPLSWVNYYKSAFERIRNTFSLSLSDSDIEKSCSILTSFNPRISFREIEYQPEQIFLTVTKHWNIQNSISDILYEFFKGIELKPVIYEDTISTLIMLKKRGYKIATLTDLPTAMPDEIFKNNIIPILNNIDLYVSSLSCGFRKPNRRGIDFISNFFQIDNQSIVLVGDERKDIQTAKNAQCHSILIERKNDISLDYGQDLTIDSLEGLYNAVCRL